MEKSCWWMEGGRCYSDPYERDEHFRSKKYCEGKCNEYISKREMLSGLIPNDKLIIFSELTDKEKSNV